VNIYCEVLELLQRTILYFEYLELLTWHSNISRLFTDVNMHHSPEYDNVITLSDIDQFL